MATSKTTGSDLDLRDEFEALRAQVTDLLEILQDKGQEKSAKLADKLGAELNHYQEKAGKAAQDAYEAGNAGLDEIGARIRRNPLASLAIAFGAGYVLSKLLGSEK